MTSLVDALLLGIRDCLDKPYAFFGHSMGALVAFEVSRALRRQGLKLPRIIVISGRRAPTVPNNEPPLHHLAGDDDFVDALARRYDAIPQVVRDEPELMALFVPVLKADFATFETHVHRDEAPLECALALYGGHADPQTKQMAGWADSFFGPLPHPPVSTAGHFYLAEQRRAVAAALAEDVLAGVPAA